MFLVVDSNRVFSAFLSKGRVFEIFSINNIVNMVEFIAPEFLLFEIGNHFDEILERSKLSSDELAKLFRFLKEEIEFIPFNEFNMHANEADKLAPHPKDVQYFALALAFGCPIWSEEKAFKKQPIIKVFNTDELRNLLISRLPI